MIYEKKTAKLLLILNIEYVNQLKLFSCFTFVKLKLIRNINVLFLFHRLNYINSIS